MKKLFVILAMLIVFSVVAYATPSVDVKTMSDAELEGLRDLINDELESRGVSSNVDSDEKSFYSGIYYIGTNLESGSYEITANDDAVGITYELYKDEESYESGDYISSDVIWNSEDENTGVSLVLKDGMILDFFITSGSATIKKIG